MSMSARIESRVARSTSGAEISTPRDCACALTLAPMLLPASAQSPSSAEIRSLRSGTGQPGRCHDGPLAFFATSPASSFRLWKNDCHSASTVFGSASWRDMVRPLSKSRAGGWGAKRNNKEPKACGDANQPGPAPGNFSFTLFNGSMRQAKDVRNESRFPYFGQRLAEPGWRRGNLDSGRLHGGDLGIRTAFATGDDRAGMSHSSSGRSSPPGDEPDHRLLAAAFGFVLKKLRGVFFRGAAGLADHDDRFGCLVGQEHFQHFDEVGAFDR